ncbi:putative lateral flagellar export/assembly protein LafU [Citrobacter farmeri]|uniref:putative lateral flagellar export/assembly protein LafU n=1 Tax=Citrobacter farmeri TaxID=67824 RepID=UPI00189F06B1|nr:putative lateral flagellar export/assembly protein LafU [Citrobacter farmeri]EHK0945813.1 putative lateral flagellar export/assembly protein LafU [Citrobacter farmeri]EKX4541403.1 putative lateral flagellar export/assembly protein LafU [Citrobacter farmeri]MDB2166193.1 putative lateral flagellar export/assembly protein LafU [Citrobacter farmeri]HBC0358538.1 putative lateral flagellar export/assembly protein LafU [Citrobacter farmeri]HBZ8835219.1 putative lateral flagellar export/assembly pr
MRKAANRRERGGHTTIIRRQIKKNHSGHHGGAWKVAFADFTLAMMALFMTLWIVNSVSKSDRENIVAALHGQSIFNGGGLTPLNKIGQKPITRTVSNNTRSRNKPGKEELTSPKEVVQVSDETEKKVRDVNEKTSLLKRKSASELGELATSINIVARNAHMETNLEMEIVPQGLRVLIKDDQNRNMFERGSARIMPFFRSLLVELAPVFDSLDNKIIITGHTDAMGYKNNIYNNWNLSGDRALSARRVLEEAGMPDDKVMQVSAMADQMLLDNKNPQSAGNRRIEIMILTQSAADTLYQYFGQHGEKVVQPLVEKLDKKQQIAALHHKVRPQ